MLHSENGDTMWHMIQWDMMPFNAFQAWISKIEIFLWIIRPVLSVVMLKTQHDFTVCLKERIVFSFQQPKDTFTENYKPQTMPCKPQTSFQNICNWIQTLLSDGTPSNTVIWTPITHNKPLLKEKKAFQSELQYMHFEHFNITLL